MMRSPMTQELRIAPKGTGAIRLSIGIIVRNEQDAIGAMLESLFRQTLFEELTKRGWLCEIICVANGCTDNTVEIAQKMFQEQSASHPFAEAFQCQVVPLARPGKLHAWNQFVHRLSAREAECLILSDGDIVVHNPATLWNMYATLQTNKSASVATDEPLKDISFRRSKTWRERISLATSRMTQSLPAQLSGQLYCIRTPVARNIYLPRDLMACEDGFIKTLVCTFFLTRPGVPSRVMRAADASHVFQAYMGLLEILRNQKRQMIGQTIVHVLVDEYLPTLRLEERLNLAETLHDKDRFDPDWLRRLIRAHMQRTRHFWHLFPDALSFRFMRLDGIKGFHKLAHLPAGILGLGISVFSCWLAYHFLKDGFETYWPDTKSPRLQDFKPDATPKEVCELTTTVTTVTPEKV
ncbi:MAG TPA: glycosyltransferase family 2 protein [Candidatus Binatia bacterium]|nr:glycosyltransferase family 2 protein [Candidatus Binatia bacterium]